MDDYESSYFSRLPHEVFCLIFKLLSRDEKIALKFAYIGQHAWVFLVLKDCTIYWLNCVDVIYCRHINIRESFCFSKENVLKILQLHPNPNVVTKLDFSFCYWIPKKEITEFVKQCTNLKELAVAHSTIGSQELEEILCENVHVTKLSFSIHDSEGFEQNEKLVNYYLHQPAVWEDPLSLLHLGKCRKILSQLETLELHMGQYPIILATIIR